MSVTSNPALAPRVLPILAAAAFLLPAGLLAQDLSGSWTHEGPAGTVSLELAMEGGEVTGTMRGADGTLFQLRGSLDANGVAEGSVSMAGDTGWFAAGLEGTGLLMVVAELDPATGQPNLDAGWTMEFVRDGSVAAAPAAPEPRPEAGKDERGEQLAGRPHTPREATMQTETFRHQTGFSFRHPADWRVEESAQGLALIPPDAAVDATGQPAELFLIGSQEAPGIARPDDPQVLAFFEQAFVPLSRVGGAEAVESGLGPGAVLTFRGQMGADQVERHVYVTLHDGQAVYLLHAARQDLAAARADAVERVFGSFAWETPRVAETAPRGETAGRGHGAEGQAGMLDPNLIRTWRHESTDGSTGGGGAVYVEDRTTLVLQADGTALLQEGSTVAADVPGVAGYAGGDPSVLRGEWSIEDGMLALRWEDGTGARFEYSVFLHRGEPALSINLPGEEPMYFR